MAGGILASVVANERLIKPALVAILVVFCALATVYSVVVPPFEASDELWHYPMVKVIADTWALPVQDPANVGPWRQEGSQPPLYYFLGALATAWIDTSDMPEVRRLNPHVDNGVVTPDGNINLVVHDPVREAFPWRGTVLAVHIVRFLSVIMATAGVYLTWLIVWEVFPARPWWAVGAASIHAFTPMVVFIAGAVNNDNLTVPLSSLALWLLLRIAKRGCLVPQPSEGQMSMADIPFRSYLLLGVVLGLAALTKASSLALMVLTAFVVSVRAVRQRSWEEFFKGGLGTLVPVLVIAGWWYARNWFLYGDPTGLNVFIAILGQREVPADLFQLWRERYSFAAGYWGNFGGLNVPLPAWAYAVLNTCAVLALLGLVIWPVRLVLGGRRAYLLRYLRSPDGFALLLCLLWGAGVVVPWARWASVTWSSQGRLIFAALPVWSLLLVIGLAGWLPECWDGLGYGALALLLLGLSVVAPWVWIRPAYALPQPLQAEEMAAIPHPLQVDFGGVVRLLGYGLDANSVLPGGQLEVMLYWEALERAERDYTVFVHLVGSAERLIAQRDTFPGLGRLSTRRLTPGFRWADRVVLQVPATAYTPDVAAIELGLYDAITGARLPATTPGEGRVGDHVRFGHVEIRQIPGPVPNPIRVNFGDRVSLIGYDLDRLAVSAGEELTLTLYFQASRTLGENYTISTQLVDVHQRKAAQQDSWPHEGTLPTLMWRPGEVIVEERRLRIYPDAPVGAYAVRVVVYVLDDQGRIVHLPVTPSGGRMQSTFIELTTVRVVGP